MAGPELRYIYQLVLPPGWENPRLSQPVLHQLYVAVSGALQVETNEAVLVVKPGSVVLLPRGTQHEQRVEGKDPAIVLYLAWEGSDNELADIPLRVVDEKGRIESTLRWLRELHPARTAEDTQVVEGLVRAVLRELRYAPTSPADERILRTCHYIQQSLTQTMSVASMAKVAGLSESTFARAFKATTGHAPMEYVRQERVRAAKVFLGTTRLPLSRISELVGLRDEYELSRVFRRVTGHSPGAYRDRS